MAAQNCGGTLFGPVRYRHLSIGRWTRQTRALIASKNAPVRAAPPAIMRSVGCQTADRIAHNHVSTRRRTHSGTALI